jgi:hypothetical protein
MTTFNTTELFKNTSRETELTAHLAVRDGTGCRHRRRDDQPEAAAPAQRSDRSASVLI